MFCRISYYSTYHSTTLLAPVSDPTSQHGVCTVLLFRRHNPGGHWYLVCLVYVRKEVWSLPRSVLKTVYIPNFKVEWVAFLLRDQEVKGSTLGPAIGYGELEYIYIRFNSVRWSKSSDNTSNQATMASFLILFNSPFNNNLSIRRFKLQSFWTVHEWRKRTVLSRSSPATLVTAQLLSVCLTTRLLHYWRIQASLRHYSPRAPDVTAPALHDYKNTYRSLDAIVAQSKPAHLEMTVRLT
jgi:hypothetical protein